MIKFENVVLPSTEQWRAIITGMRNPLASWQRSDSYVQFESPHDMSEGNFVIGTNDHDLMMRLAKAGSEHAKYRRMIVVYVDITVPLLLWKQIDTYQIGVVKNSTSTMHKIHAKEFTLEDFSCEHLEDFDEPVRKDDNGLCRFPWFKTSLESTIDILNYARELYIKTKDKKYWRQMIDLLPSCYNQKRTVMMNYEVLANIYHQRKGHKLDEWKDFCDWIKTLPYSEIITLED